jgi:hypothetical protein
MTSRFALRGSTDTPENARLMPLGVTFAQPPPATWYFQTWPAVSGSGGSSFFQSPCGPEPSP